MRWLITAYLVALVAASIVWFRVGCDVGYERGFDDAVDDYDLWAPHLANDAALDDDDRGR